MPAGRTARSTIVAESDLNDPRIIQSPDRGGYGLDAQWSDDFHHAVHALLTGETPRLLRRLRPGRATGRACSARRSCTPAHTARTAAASTARLLGDLPGDRFVVCIQNHDQVGNRARGDRLTTLLDSPAKHRLAASLMLLSPHLPLLFMGEEYGEDRPFPFFCSFCGAELVQAVREGRKREFADFLGEGEEVPLPDAEQTFASAVLSWKWPEGSVCAGVRRMYCDLLAAHRSWPGMRDFSRRSARLISSNVVELIRGESLALLQPHRCHPAGAIIAA